MVQISRANLQQIIFKPYCQGLGDDTFKDLLEHPLVYSFVRMQTFYNSRVALFIRGLVIDI